MTDMTHVLRAKGARIVAGSEPLLLRGFGLGGWMNMENFITGYPATESQMRASVAAVLGPERAARFFDRLLTRFFDEGDARLLADLGVNCVRIPVNYRHFERDERPFELREEGFERLDGVVRCAASWATKATSATSRGFCRCSSPIGMPRSSRTSA